MKHWVTKGGHRTEQGWGGRSNAFPVSSGMYRLLVDCGRQSAYKRLDEKLGGTPAPLCCAHGDLVSLVGSYRY